MTDRRNVATVERLTQSVRSDPIMRLIVLRPADAKTGGTFLEYALSAGSLDRVVLDALHRDPWRADDDPGTAKFIGETVSALWAMPSEWPTAVPVDLGERIARADAAHIDTGILRAAPRRRWLVISNGRFVTRTNGRLLEQSLGDESVDVVAVMADPQLAAYRERIRLTPQGRLVGYRRLYQDSMEPILMPADWPHHLFVNGRIADAVLDEELPGEFPIFVERLRSRRLRLKALAAAGSLVDLDTEDGLVSVCRMMLDGTSAQHTVSSGDDNQISPRARLIGPVLIGDHVCVEPDAIIIGPSILCDHSRVRRDGVVDASIVGIDAEVAPDQVVRNAMVVAHPLHPATRAAEGQPHGRPTPLPTDEAFAFRSWDRLSYAGCFKRVADLIAAIIVLVLFAPIIPFIALAIKINSPGPVFFKHKRQGYHGKPFYCVKFRTMRAGADKLQDTLRRVSEVDGPQFKLADDPRITAVGRFLRETFLDEIPQFYNVLMGDMSVVGPRPSPESENTLCPWWRDARLSVRPGITGLWQISRTRKPLKDFQEWIHYDTQYVRQLSLRLDLWICWRTFGKMIGDFIRQF